jgi:hypothetical protein
MSLLIPPYGFGAIETNVTATTNETATFSTSVTAGTAPNKNATYTTLIATTSYKSYGIMVTGAGVQTTGSENQRCLVDIALGATSSERVIIPNLTFGNTADYGAASNTGNSYFFPIYIPSGVRVCATAAASTNARVVNLAVRLFQHSSGPGAWYGSRVTTYGSGGGNSPIRLSGTLHTPGQNTYATPTALGTTTAPIRYMQFGYDLSTDTTGGSSNYLARIVNLTASPNKVIVDHLPFKESTTVESVQYTDANFLLSRMMFNIPVGVSLGISAQRTAATPEARGFTLYGCD